MHRSPSSVRIYCLRAENQEWSLAERELLSHHGCQNNATPWVLQANRQAYWDVPQNHSVESKTNFNRPWETDGSLARSRGA